MTLKGWHKEKHLGDLVYVELENGVLRLTADGEGPTDTIYLKPRIYAALKRYASKALTPRRPSGGRRGRVRKSHADTRGHPVHE